jgi:hypothetical protein
MKDSIPDLTIQQNSFSIFFETKLSDWFYSDQLQRHIEGIKNKSDINILFVLSNFELDDLQERFKNDIKKAKENGVILQPTTFEDFVGALESVQSSDQYKNFLREFVSYLDRTERLPKWKYMLDVVSCGGTLDEVNRGVYICPDSGGAYRHRRAKYFGPYANKKVHSIFEIKAVVSIERGITAGKVKWKNHNESDDNLIVEAINKIKESEQWRIDEANTIDLQVFLLDNECSTNFFKSTSGGMVQSKLYFWDIAKDCNNSKELAEKLKNKSWESFK